MQRNLRVIERHRRKRKKENSTAENQKLSYFYTPYRKEFLADNTKFMTFIPSEIENVCFLS